MADNVSVTPGAGAAIAADDVSSVFYQRVKLDGGGDGVSVPIVAGAGVEAGALLVTLPTDGTGKVGVGNPGAATIAKAEDAASADGDVGVPAMAIQQSSPANTAANGDYAMLQMDAGRLWTSGLVTAAAASIGKAEDVASADADVGVPAMAIQKATPADTAGTDGDYAMLQMSGGRLWTSTTIPSGNTSIAKAEDVASANGDVGVPAMAIQRATPGDTSLTDGDWSFLQVGSGRLWTSAKITDGGGTALGLSPDAVASLADPALAFLAVRQSTPANRSDANGDYENPQISAGRLWVSGDNTSGDIAHDAADSGNPVKVGGKASAAFSLPTAVSAGDRANLVTDLHGRVRVVSHPDDINRLGVYYWHSGALTVAASADAAATSEGGRLWIINPVASSVVVRIRKVTFRSQLGSALLAPTSPRFTLEKCVFTGTDSGSAVTPAKRRTADASPGGTGRTSNTGLDVTSAAVVASFFPVASASAVAYCTPAEASFEPGPEDHIDLVAGELIVIRQADAGTASDTRRFTVDVVTEEF